MERCPVFSWLHRSLHDGWVAVAPQGAQAQAVHVVWPAGERPSVLWACRLDWTDPQRALRDLRRQRQLHRHHTALVLSRAHYQLLPTDAPDVPRESWPDAVRWRIKDLVDFPVENARVDLLEIPAETNQRGRPSLLVAVAPRAGLVPLAEAAMRSRTPWEVMDLPEVALRNIAALKEDPGMGLALLLVGDSSAMLVITASGELLLARHIDVTQAQLASDDDSVRQQAFDRTGLELQRTLDSFERQFNRVNLARLLVSPVAGLEAFLDYVRELVYVPVAPCVLDGAIDFSRADLADGLTPDTVCRIALGAALRRS